jgi:excisionase family DNA binding protein
MRPSIDTVTDETKSTIETQAKVDETNDNLSLLVSVEQAAKILGIGRTRFFDLIMSHAVTSVKIGRRRLIVRSSLAEFVERLVSEQDIFEEDRVVSHH